MPEPIYACVKRLVAGEMGRETNRGGRGAERNVDEYLRALPEPDRSALEHLRSVIRAAAPNSEETISYRIPAFRFHGPLVFFAATPRHLSLYGVSPPRSRPS